MELTDLHGHCLEHIIDFLDISSFYNFSRTCRFLLMFCKQTAHIESWERLIWCLYIDLMNHVVKDKDFKIRRMTMLNIVMSSMQNAIKINRLITHSANANKITQNAVESMKYILDYLDEKKLTIIFDGGWDVGKQKSSESGVYFQRKTEYYLKHLDAKNIQSSERILIHQETSLKGSGVAEKNRKTIKEILQDFRSVIPEFSLSTNDIEHILRMFGFELPVTNQIVEEKEVNVIELECVKERIQRIALDSIKFIQSKDDSYDMLIKYLKVYKVFQNEEKCFNLLKYINMFEAVFYKLECMCLPSTNLEKCKILFKYVRPLPSARNKFISRKAYEFSFMMVAGNKWGKGLCLRFERTYEGFITFVNDILASSVLTRREHFGYKKEWYQQLSDVLPMFQEFCDENMSSKEQNCVGTLSEYDLYCFLIGFHSIRVSRFIESNNLVVEFHILQMKTKAEKKAKKETKALKRVK